MTHLKKFHAQKIGDTFRYLIVLLAAQVNDKISYNFVVIESDIDWGARNQR